LAADVLSAEPFGAQVVAFVAVSEAGQPGWGGLKQKARTVTRCADVRFRPLSSTETPVTQTDVTTEIWKLTAPPVAAALAVASNGELVYDGTDHPESLDPGADSTRPFVFQIDGKPMPRYDFDGSLHHVTIFAKRQVG
jgi:hypothetical protein